MFCSEDQDPKTTATISSVTAGVIFGIGWWVYIDGAAVAEGTGRDPLGYSWLPGVGTTLCFLMINMMSWSQLSDDMNQRGMCMARAFLFSAMIIGLGCISVALFIMVNEYLNGGDEVGTKWPGIALMIQNLLIFVSTFIMRFGTMPSQDDLV
mmetsp:Transcript_1433/g.2956  ORF Transcript_1433/g.2956 Transcript_1433/m.2956 type:complete len:152 (+) Transcript_1433:130-585(+)